MLQILIIELVSMWNNFNKLQNVPLLMIIINKRIFFSYESDYNY